MHAVGDIGGNVATGVYKNYADKLVGYDLLNGVYSFAGEGTTLTLSLDAELCAPRWKRWAATRAPSGSIITRRGRSYA